MMLRNIISAAAAVALACLISAPASADVGITINGNAVNVYPAPILQSGRVFVPLRGVFENLGASVVYNNGQINATNNNSEISLTIGSTQATVNGSPVTIDVAPFIVGESTYVPLRFVSQALGAQVYWDDQNQVVDITAGTQGGNNSDNNNNQVSIAPPPIPAYQPPPVPAPNYIWIPGYWAWSSYGYYWVPGTWILAPQVGLLWTPGYWGWNNGFYLWHSGYWASQIGFYGGINYGGGYYGHGYVGGMWQNNAFRYNTAVAPVSNTTAIKNVYVNKTVIVNNTTINRISYNGGPGGLAARPTTTEAAVGNVSHVAMTPAQKQHVQVAAQDRALLAKVNAGTPPLVTAARPFTYQSKPQSFTPVTPADRLVQPRAATAPPEPGRAIPKPTIPPQTAPVRPQPTPVRNLGTPTRTSHPMITPRPLPTQKPHPKSTATAKPLT